MVEDEQVMSLEDDSDDDSDEEEFDNDFDRYDESE